MRAVIIPLAGQSEGIRVDTANAAPSHDKNALEIRPPANILYILRQEDLNRSHLLRAELQVYALSFSKIIALLHDVHRFFKHFQMICYHFSHSFAFRLVEKNISA